MLSFSQSSASHAFAGGARMAEEEELAAWESQSIVPLPDIHAKK